LIYICILMMCMCLNHLCGGIGASHLVFLICVNLLINFRIYCFIALMVLEWIRVHCVQRYTSISYDYVWTNTSPLCDLYMYTDDVYVFKSFMWRNRCITPCLFNLCKLIDKFQNLLFYCFDGIGMNKSTLCATIYIY
jgi:hypothetical protein